ncbi:MAG: DeoR/GlpR family DNA-binding transcription regulator [Anaerolineae bacterium]|nr:DeoR/GlpR family DNA-binding transcription regulator [Anaerolineae bacterium]NUQ05409.1 DeoR/GlpR transcriptional regulator [Anaerolineae bacterium]
MANSDLLGLERQEKITQALEQRGTLTVAQISAMFEVSEATVRRDLTALAARDVIRRVHGGAMVHHAVATSEAPIVHRQKQNAEIKRRIGRAAVQLIHSGETVLLIGGSTGLAVARELAHHASLTIVTDSLLVANELMRQGIHRVIMLGGMIDADEFAVRGTLSRLILAELQVDKVIVGTKAISAERGLSAESAEEAELFRSYLKAGHSVIVVTDSSKFRQSALARIAPVESIDILVTDSHLPEEVADKLREAGVIIQIAE